MVFINYKCRINLQPPTLGLDVTSLHMLYPLNPFVGFTLDSFSIHVAVKVNVDLFSELTFFTVINESK